MSINTFKSKLTNGGARANQFEVLVTFPTLVPNSANANAKVPYLCEAASLPASTIEVAEGWYRGRRVPFAGERNFQPWTLTFLNENFEVYNAFQSWSNSMNNVSTNQGVIDWSQYTTQLVVNQLDRNDNVIKTFTFQGAFPIDVSAIDLNFASNNQIEKFNVTFDYTNWV